MITMYLWANYGYFFDIYGYRTTPLRIMELILASILTIPLDIVLLPIEIISIIIYFIKEKDNDGGKEEER